MKKAQIAELKAHLSSYLRFVKKGEKVIVYSRDVPIAELAPYEGAKSDLQVIEPQRDLKKLWSERKNPKTVSLTTDSLSLLLEDRKR